AQTLDLLLDFRPSRLQFLGPRFQLSLLSGRAFLLGLQLLLCPFQLLAQLAQLAFQFTAPFANLASLLFSSLPKLGLFSQAFSQALDTVKYVPWPWFLGPCFERGRLLYLRLLLFRAFRALRNFRCLLSNAFPLRSLFT